ncbi:MULTISPECIES: PIN domain-containing protein [unclassified Flavobacterium]|uniref:PIN domain-containing protein n=1 Tax=unclassified Flavobacterium TaxID=196869 RepID=UPI001291DF11|nr:MULTISPECIES: PIN domain-containing protein [unclassified Flavobacterium]MQP52428.1 hypothetical protein [Flavobacterium sp. LMO9]MQP62498.1 hypothetical protein [Flavobacterium sp. LMO6]
MREKVIFDTNVVRNPEINNFLGGREILERFTQDADIVIPDTVIQEIKRQKRSSLVSNKTKFLTNPFHKLIGVDEANTKSFDVEDYIQKLLDTETIPFETIDLKDHSVLPLIKELAILKKAPFEAGDNTDKGFKDALIYFTILEYLQEIPNKYVFVFAKDARFKEALANHPNIIIIDSYDDFKKYGISQFYDSYFIENINAVLGITITKDNIKEYWFNINDNIALLIEFEGQEYVIETDSMEIIDHCNRNEYVEEIENLIKSTRFVITHRAIGKLMPYINYLSDKEIARILNASLANEDIRRIIADDDVKEFIGSLYDSKKEVLTDKEVLQFLKETFE